MLTATLLTLSLFAVAPARDDSAFLRAVAEKETGNNPAAIGAHHERGRCQFMPETWARYTREPLRKAATDQTLASSVERQHLAWLAAYLRANGVPATPFNLAMAWNAGPGAVIRREVSAATRQYAREVVNLFEVGVGQKPDARRG